MKRKLSETWSAVALCVLLIVSLLFFRSDNPFLQKINERANKKDKKLIRT